MPGQFAYDLVGAPKVARACVALDFDVAMGVAENIGHRAAIAVAVEERCAMNVRDRGALVDGKDPCAEVQA